MQTNERVTPYTQGYFVDATAASPVRRRFIRPVRDAAPLVAHLAQAGKVLAQNAGTPGCLVLADTLETGLDAAARLAGVLLGENAAASIPAQTADDELQAALRNAGIELASEPELTTVQAGDFIIYRESEFEPASPALPRPPAFPEEKARVLVLCDTPRPLGPALCNWLVGRTEATILVLPAHAAAPTEIERLALEQGLVPVRVHAPKDAYYLQLADSLLAERLVPEAWLKQSIAALRRSYGDRLNEGAVTALCCNALRRAAQKELTAKDLLPPAAPTTQSAAAKDTLVGLTEIKETLAGTVAYGKMMLAADRRDEIRLSMAFTGNPGTAKTSMARHYAAQLAAAGLTNGIFVEVGRGQLTGNYLGETEHKTAAVFAQARGGVLFVDEAGALAQGGQDYGRVALSTLVQLMENHPDTVVIFATYPEQMDRLFALEPGLRSRCAEVLHFADYTPAALCTVFEAMAADRGFVPGDDCRPALERYFAQKATVPGFGNGREARNLLQQALIEYARQGGKAGKNIPLPATTLNAAIARLNAGGATKRRVGF